MNKTEYLKPFVERREKVRRLMESGLTHAEIARAMKISRQRVHQIAKEMKNA